MAMDKKTIVLIMLLLLTIAGGGAFWWWQSGKELRELNKDLPEGVKVVKSLTGQYRVANERDGYRINWPKKKLRIVYYEERQNVEKTLPPFFPQEVKKLFVSGTDLFLGEYIILPEVEIGYFKLKNGIDLEKFRQIFENSPFADSTINLEQKGEFEVLIIKDSYQVNYSFKINSKLYSIVCPEEDLCQNILQNSKWSL
ncbi:MAG: hypothetical protein DDT19_00921 [Syntrophomonadaceae bacterium]|nr:hypothetical protein [Bacillota bacterium]